MQFDNNILYIIVHNKSVLSSEWLAKPVAFITKSKSQRKILNNKRGSTIDPWGTPNTISAQGVEMEIYFGPLFAIWKIALN